MPERKIYHITHIDNVAPIWKSGCLVSDAERLKKQLQNTNIGMLDIKSRRLDELDVGCHPPTKVGQYVPFNFCPRSVMLYLLHMGNRPGLTYKGGQRPIVHLEADLKEAIEWANTNDVRWAFTPCNAGANYATFYADQSQLDKINWNAVVSTDFRASQVKEGKQAEFLIHGAFPCELVRRVGVIDVHIQTKVASILAGCAHPPSVDVTPTWYY